MGNIDTIPFFGGGAGELVLSLGGETNSNQFLKEILFEHSATLSSYIRFIYICYISFP